MRQIKPQEGFQEQFLTSTADITIGGGAAGVGKTFALLLEPLRHRNNPDFGAVIFRRTYAQIEMEGGLWDKSGMLYPLFNAKGREGKDWLFPKGASISFSHLQYEKNLYDHQGSEYALILFDELTHFTEKMFFYLLSRNRSMCGVKPYIMATCNPDPESWVAHFIEWWIDQETGFAIPERAGKLRYMYRHDDNILWADSKDEILKQVPIIVEIAKSLGLEPHDLIKSVTFIPGNINDNKELLLKDPSYLANLLAMSPEEKLRLLDGNWKISLDKKMIAEYAAIERVFDNYPDPVSGRYITVDAARYGRDFLVIFVWSGWEVVWTSVMTMSSTWDIQREIEKLRAKFFISRAEVIIDQDGVGRNTVKIGRYVGFSGGLPAKIDRDPKTLNRKKDVYEYENLKAQCVFRFLELRVNQFQLRITISSENCTVDGEFTTKIKIGSKVHDVRDLIKADLRSYRRVETPEEVTDTKKKKLESKDLQKIILKGRSPDFGDALFMREYFALSPAKKGVVV